MMFSIIATITLVAKGGRRGPIKSGYQCPMLIENEHWDCYVTFSGGLIYPGDTRSGVKIEFLSPDQVAKKLRVHSTFHFTEGPRIVVTGSVDQCNS